MSPAAPGSIDPASSVATARRDRALAVIGRHAMTWQRPATAWRDGALLGNGAVGAVVWGAGPLVVNVDHTGFWDRRGPDIDTGAHRFEDFCKEVRGEPSDWPGQWPVRSPRSGRLEGPTRLPPSRLDVTLRDPDATVTAMRLDLVGAVCEVTWERRGDTTVMRIWTPRDAEAVVIECDEAFDVAVTFLRDIAKPPTQPAFAADPRAYFHATESPQAEVGPDRSWWQLDLPDSPRAALGLACAEPEATAAVFTLGHDAGDELAARARAVLATLPEVRAEHDERWAASNARSWVEVPDPRIERLWCIEMYKLTACTRPGAPAISLCGPWSPDGVMPTWGGDYHHNVNVQMSYAPVWTANRLDEAESLFELIEQSRPAFEQFCRDHFGVEGQFVPSGSDLWGRCRYEWATPNLAFSSGPWLGFLLWQHWRHTRDAEFLRTRLVPFLRAIARPLLAQLREGDDGLLHLPMTYAPEYMARGVRQWGPDATIDLALYRWLLDALVETDSALPVEERADAGDVAAWRATVDRLAPLPADPTPSPWMAVATGDPTGLRVRGDVAYARSHRHLSHLMPIHPLRQLTLERGVAQPAAERTLIRDSVRNMLLQGQGEWVGFTLPWAASIAAHTGLPDLARAVLEDYAERWITGSSLMVQGSPDHSAFTVWNELADDLGDAVTLEAGFGFAAAILDLLLQSHGRVIRLFPAVPTRWADVSFGGLLAEGGIEVDGVWRDGRFATARLGATARAATAGEPVCIRVPVDGRAVSVDRADAATTVELADGMVEVLWIPSSAKPTLEIRTSHPG